MKKIFMTSVLLLTLTASGCSYVIDSIEGAITDRASFSVEVSVDRVADTVTVSWKDAFGGEAFAGYEILVSAEADNEFAGYEVAAAGYDINQGIVIGSLNDSTTRSVTIPYNAAVMDGHTYFYRLAVVHWDKEKEADRNEDWTDPPWASNKAQWYNGHSNIEKVSGVVQVDF
jgi:hypothetical protein